MESENLDTCSTILTDALKFIPGEARDLLRNAPRIAIDLQNDNIYLKTSSKSNVGRTDRYIFKFFLERASISDFCCNTNQNNRMTHTIVRFFYNPVENSSRGHPLYPSEISTL